MIRICVILTVLGYCSSRPQFENPLATILEYVNVVGPYGYNFRYSTSDGIGREERGELTYPGTPEENYIVQGKTTWTSPEGISHIIAFISDNNGYRTIKPESYQTYNPQEHSVYPVELARPRPTPPAYQTYNEQPSVYRVGSPQPELPIFPIYSGEPQRPAPAPKPAKPTIKPADRPTVSPVKPYVPPAKSTTFGPAEDRLPEVNKETPNGSLQRAAEGVLPGNTRVGAGTAAALLG